MNKPAITTKGNGNLAILTILKYGGFMYVPVLIEYRL